MAKERILVVEDEGIVAADLELILQKLGYEVVGTVPTGEEAIEVAEKAAPNLVLMDIRLKGKMDGIDAAEQISARFNIPITFLTAYADEATLKRAKSTMPYGYILKPFHESDIRAVVEVALYKHKMESMMQDIQSWYGTALRTMPDAVLATDKNGRLTFMNERAESLLGRKMQDAYGKPLEDILPFSTTLPSFLTQTLPVYSEAPVSLSTKDGRLVQVQYSVAPLKDAGGQITGRMVVLHPATQ